LQPYFVNKTLPSYLYLLSLQRYKRGTKGGTKKHYLFISGNGFSLKAATNAAFFGMKVKRVWFGGSPLLGTTKAAMMRLLLYRGNKGGNKLL
jgi:hypothetical protein